MKEGKSSKVSYVFNIQHYSLHDGPGIRTIVFLKGCPMKCRWCCNPESQRYEQELSYVENRCIGRKACGLCSKNCTEGIRFKEEPGQDQAVLDMEKCRHNLALAEVCPAKAIKKEGEVYTVEELLHIVERDGIFFGHGDGGLTVSGGEPLSHPDLLLPLLKEARRRRIHTSIETCGYASYKILKEAAEYLDYILFDIKSMDTGKHLSYTGRNNDVILDNFDRLCRDFPRLTKKVRTPVIPEFNDTVDDINKIIDFIRNRPNVIYEPLPYHSFGRGKYKALGREYAMGDIKLDPAKMEAVRNLYAAPQTFAVQK